MTNTKVNSITKTNDMHMDALLPYQLANCFIYAQALLEHVIIILWVRSFSKMSVKFTEDKMLV